MSLSFSVPWKDCLLFWEFYGLKLHHLGLLLTGEVSSGDRFVSTSEVAWASIGAALSAVFGLHWGDIPEGGGAIGPAERNINTTKKITEHVTESYHIETLIKISKRNDALVPRSNYKWNAASPEKCSSFHVYLT